MTITTTSQTLSLVQSKRKFLEAVYKSPQLQEIERIRCKRDLKYFLWGDGVRHDGYAWTVDPHDKDRPIKRLPKKDYLVEMADIWLKENLLLVPKSRQLLMSWLFCALYLWDTQFNYGRYTYFQSKKEEDADYLVQDRAGFILKHEPFYLWPKGFDPEKHISYCSIAFDSINSYIIGIPEGGDQIRSQVPSGLFSDEAAFQPEFEKAVGAVQACVKNGGKFTGVSSANEGYFCELVHEGTEY